jgi:hypothetical protein
MPGRHQTPHRRATELHTSSVNSTAATELHYQSATELHILGRLWPKSVAIRWRPRGELSRVSWSLVAPSVNFADHRGGWWRICDRGMESGGAHALAIAGRDGLRITPLSPREIRASG